MLHSGGRIASTEMLLLFFRKGACNEVQHLRSSVIVVTPVCNQLNKAAGRAGDLESKANIHTRVFRGLAYVLYPFSVHQEPRCNEGTDICVPQEVLKSRHDVTPAV